MDDMVGSPPGDFRVSDNTGQLLRDSKRARGRIFRLVAAGKHVHAQQEWVSWTQASSLSCARCTLPICERCPVGFPRSLQRRPRRRFPRPRQPNRLEYVKIVSYALRSSPRRKLGIAHQLVSDPAMREDASWRKIPNYI